MINALQNNLKILALYSFLHTKKIIIKSKITNKKIRLVRLDCKINNNNNKTQINSYNIINN